MRKLVRSVIPIIISLCLLIFPQAAYAQGMPFGFPVPAIEECPAQSVTNPFPMRAMLTAFAEGTWTYKSGGPMVNADGVFGADCSTCRFDVPPYRVAQLIAYTGGDSVKGTGTSMSFDVFPGEEVKFCFNDRPGSYGDNEGVVYVTGEITPLSSDFF
ncbi:MAG: hypothetical protein F6K41_27920 [Symploca sp. SIO3E6]|nr:hypothetical protein [Caldora sp. SIO3E6]